MWLLALLLLIRTDIVVEGDLARQMLPATGAPADAVARSRVIYLNHTGALLRPGMTDASANTTSIIDQPVRIPAWNTDAHTWAETVACFTRIYAPFDAQIVDEDPGNIPHIEAIFGGTASLVGLPANIAGVSPFTADCSIIESSIVFTFTGSIRNITSQEACEIMAQEVAHSYGLDHELLAADPMTYLAYDGERSFQDQAVSCGEYEPRPCGIAGMACRPDQNSVQLLLERVGKARTTPRPDAPSGQHDLIPGCSAGGPTGLLGVVVGLGIVLRRRRR
jgi:uncharacterized protein (TIGR03382 family)